MSARRRFVQAVRERIERETSNVPALEYGRVVKASPLAIELHSSALVLDEDDILLGQHAASLTLDVGTTVVGAMIDEEFLLIDALGEQTATATFEGDVASRTGTNEVRLGLVGGRAAVVLGGDVELRRDQPSLLATGATFHAQGAVATKAAPGTPTDGDFPGTERDGMLVVDTAASKLWVRVAGAWKSVNLT